MSEQQRHARLVAIRQNIAANRRRALLVRWQEQRERLLAIRPRSEAEHQAQCKPWRCWTRQGRPEHHSNRLGERIS
ncbi:MAG: hypothetical protein IPK63_19290 [Candidatus Competibacteraceae bacterium]|nr:hypothetical protein [Candidatus Competibacteraceae bacterium]